MNILKSLRNYLDYKHNETHHTHVIKSEEYVTP